MTHPYVSIRRCSNMCDLVHPYVSMILKSISMDCLWVLGVRRCSNVCVCIWNNNKTVDMSHSCHASWCIFCEYTSRSLWLLFTNLVRDYWSRDSTSSWLLSVPWLYVFVINAHIGVRLEVCNYFTRRSGPWLYEFVSDANWCSLGVQLKVRD